MNEITLSIQMSRRETLRSAKRKTVKQNIEEIHKKMASLDNRGTT